MVDYNAIHRTLLRYTGGDSNMAWESISKAYLRLDQSRTEEEQAAFIIKSAKGHILDVYTKTRNTAFISGSELTNPDDEEANTLLDELTASVDVRPEQALKDEFIGAAPPELVEAVTITLDALFDGYFKTPVTADKIRKLLQNHTNIKGNLNRMAQDVYNHIKRGC